MSLTIARPTAPVPRVRAPRVPDGWALAPLAWGLALLLVGAGVGRLFTLDAPVANQRLLGLVLDTALGLLVVPALWRSSERGLRLALLVTILLTLPVGLWMVAASGPDLFRGTLGEPLRLLTLPLVGAVDLTAPVAFTNTWFIVGYNGVAELALLAIFAASALFLACPEWRPWRGAAGAVIVAGTYVILGTGARGPLLGLILGACLILLLSWRRGWLLGVLAVAAAFVLAATGLLDKGLDVSSTTGRFEYWSDLGRLLVEYPFTGLGLGVDTPNTVALFFEINPDPERIAYAHNTFVQAYLEQGPLGLLGMLWLPLLAVLAAAYGLRSKHAHALGQVRRALLLASLGLLVALEVHGLTDQVLTTNAGDALLILSVAGVLGSLTPAPRALVAGWSRMAVPATCLALVLAGLLACFLPPGHLLLTRNLGALHLDSALLPSSTVNHAELAQAEADFQTVLTGNPTDPIALRDMARAQLAAYDVSDALATLQEAAQSPSLDAFDMLQVAHLYRDLGFTDDAYTWASRAYATWDRPPSQVVMLTYEEASLADNPNARVLAQQAEAASSAGDLPQALALFQQALTLAPGNTYLQERIDGTQRGIARQQATGITATPEPAR